MLTFVEFSVHDQELRHALSFQSEENLVGLSKFLAISKFCIFYVGAAHELLSLTVHSSCIVNTFSASLPNIIHSWRQWNLVDCIWFVTCTVVTFLSK